VADRVREVLAAAIREDLRDPRIGFVTVTDVSLSPDLRHARVWVSVLENPELSLRALNHAASFLRGRLAREAGLRQTPDLRFEIDRSVYGGFRIERILDGEAHEAPAPAEPDDEPADPEERGS
jgi:ribosome-binding factor A